MWEVFPYEERSERGQILRQAMTQREAMRGELPSMMPNRLVSYGIFPLGEGLGAIFHDVTDRRDAQDTLRARTARRHTRL